MPLVVSFDVGTRNLGVAIVRFRGTDAAADTDTPAYTVLALHNLDTGEGTMMQRAARLPALLQPLLSPHVPPNGLLHVVIEQQPTFNAPMFAMQLAIAAALASLFPLAQVSAVHPRLKDGALALQPKAPYAARKRAAVAMAERVWTAQGVEVPRGKRDDVADALVQALAWAQKKLNLRV